MKGVKKYRNDRNESKLQLISDNMNNILKRCNCKCGCKAIYDHMEINRNICYYKCSKCGNTYIYQLYPFDGECLAIIWSDKWKLKGYNNYVLKKK